MMTGLSPEDLSCCQNSLNCRDAFAFLVATVPSGAANVGIVAAYGMRPHIVKAGAVGVVAGLALFAPFTFTTVIFLLSNDTEQTWASVRLFSQFVKASSALMSIIVILGAYGASLWLPKTFPRDTVFHLALSMLLYALLFPCCSFHVAVCVDAH